MTNGQYSDEAASNVLDSPWLQVMDHDGALRNCSVREALQKAGEIGQIVAPSPLDVFAAHRFLLTLIYWRCSDNSQLAHTRESLLQGAVPEWLMAALQKECEQFDLLDPGKPFLQDPRASGDKRKSPGSLFAEFATGTNIAHFHHGLDAEARICLTCCVVGLMRVIPWTQSGGAGLTPSICGAPPMMLLAQGPTLAHTLGLNLVTLDGQANKAVWTGWFAPTDPSGEIPYLEALTWNPRRIFLGNDWQPGRCWRCGRDDQPTMGKLVYSKNDKTKKANGSPFRWKDPAAFYRIVGKQIKTQTFTTFKSSSEKSAAFGADLASLVKDGVQFPMVCKEAAKHAGNARCYHLIIPSTDGKAKTYDHRSLVLPDLDSKTIQAHITREQVPTAGTPRGGWREPEGTSIFPSVRQFVDDALRLLTYADWGVLANASFATMDQATAAFELMSGLYWRLGKKRSGGWLSRSAAWLTLKVMARAPATARIGTGNGYTPLRGLTKSQLSGTAQKGAYPIRFPHGRRLEAQLHDAVEKHMQEKDAGPIDWARFCHDLNQLLD